MPFGPRRERRGAPDSRAARLAEGALLGPAPHTIFRKLGGTEGGVLVHRETTAYFRVNGLGARIWELVMEEVTFAELVARLRREIEDPPADLESDTGAFLGELIRRDLVIARSLS